MAEETAQMKTARESAEKRGRVESSEWFSKDGIPLVRITCSASELIPTQAYANVTIGPVQVSRFVEDGDDEQLAEEVRRTQSLCEAAVAEERQTVHALIRARVEK
jgi:hypothetical protein